MFFVRLNKLSGFYKQTTPIKYFLEFRGFSSSLTRRFNREKRKTNHVTSIKKKLLRIALNLKRKHFYFIFPTNVDAFLAIYFFDFKTKNISF